MKLADMEIIDARARHDIVMTPGTVNHAGEVEAPWQCKVCKRYFTRRPAKPGVCKQAELIRINTAWLRYRQEES